MEELVKHPFDLPETQIISLLNGHDSPWYGPIYTYLQNQTLHIDQTRAQK